MVEKYGINVLYTSATSIRGLMRFGDQWPKRHDLSSLRLLGRVREPINPEAWRWFHDVIGEGKCPIIDTWWQTETGGFMICPLPITPLKPGSAAQPFFGNELGKIARPENVAFVESLPKTRSGKIMRRILKSRALGQDDGDLSTLEE